MRTPQNKKQNIRLDKHKVISFIHSRANSGKVDVVWKNKEGFIRKVYETHILMLA